MLGGVRTDVENHLIAAHVFDGAHVGVRSRGELARDDGVGGQRDLGAARPRLLEQRARNVEHLRLVQRAADLDSGGSKERIGKAAADDEHVDFLKQRLQNRQFGGHLGAADDGDQRARRHLAARAQAR